MPIIIPAHIVFFFWRDEKSVFSFLIWYKILFVKLQAFPCLRFSNNKTPDMKVRFALFGIEVVWIILTVWIHALFSRLIFFYPESVSRFDGSFQLFVCLVENSLFISFWNSSKWNQTQTRNGWHRMNDSQELHKIAGSIIEKQHTLVHTHTQRILFSIWNNQRAWEWFFLCCGLIPFKTFSSWEELLKCFYPFVFCLVMHLSLKW